MAEMKSRCFAGVSQDAAHAFSVQARYQTRAKMNSDTSTVCHQLLQCCPLHPGHLPPNLGYPAPEKCQRTSQQTNSSEDIGPREITLLRRDYDSRNRRPDERGD